MLFSTMLAFAAFAFYLPPTPISACEGECIKGITKAIIGNYSLPFNTAITDIANSVVSQLIRNRNYPAPPLSYLSPIIEEYHKRSYDFMENAIFKTYFHGKCQNPKTGLDPPGCPNPDCPVVCGTPGSLVHFYNVVVKHAFDASVGLYNEIVQSNSTAYQQVERGVLDAASSQHGSRVKQRQLLRYMPRNFDPRTATSSWYSLGQNISLVNEKRDDSVTQELQTILRQFPGRLEDACGGQHGGVDSQDNLPKCRWEENFKQYILSFP